MEIEADVERLFRRESGRLIAVLTRILGPSNLELAEDVVQESFVTALHSWSDEGMPDNPEAWLLTTARNRAIDAIRRERTRRTFAPDLAMYLDSEWTLSRTVDEAFREDWIKDDQLRMIFMCCAPQIATENRLPLILKTLCGLSVPAIARGLLTTESTINKRLYRTRRALEGHEFVLPDADELPAVLPTVHTALYLLFSEGYFSSGSGAPIREEFCRDAMSLTRLLVEAPAVSNSETVALLALMCFTAARLDARLDGDGQLIPLDRQDRAAWNGGLISAGYMHLERSANMEAIRASRFHLEAAIGARHCSARSFEDTDWVSICNLYDRLVAVSPGAMTRLNRAIAVSFRDGPQIALTLVEEMQAQGELPHSHVVAAALANLYARAGRGDEAHQWLETALALVSSDHERRLIELQVGKVDLMI